MVGGIQSPQWGVLQRAGGVAKEVPGWVVRCSPVVEKGAGCRVQGAVAGVGESTVLLMVDCGLLSVL